jgi:hypothetical protein
MVEDIAWDRELHEWNSPDVSGCHTVEGIRAKFLRSYDPLISVLPPAAARYVRAREIRDTSQRLLAVGDRYEMLRAVLEILRATARLPKGKAATIEAPSYIRLSGILLRVDPDGISPEFADSLDALRRVETDRIRECQNLACRRLYWAGRTDQPCCSKRCANARRVQLWRAEYATQHKLARVQKPPKTGRKSLREQNSDRRSK